VHQAGELARPLAAAGAEVILLPTVGIGPPTDPARLQSAARHADEYDWLFLTSVNAADAFLPLVPQEIRRPRLGVVGAATYRRVGELGWIADVTPAEFTAEALVAALEAHAMAGKRVLIPAGDLAREVLPTALSKRGALVEVLEAYSNQAPMETAAAARTLFREGPALDWLTFASPSAFENLAAITGIEPLGQVRIASIGPTTSAAIRARGLDVAAEAAEHTVSGLVAAIVAAAYARHQGSGTRGQ
jgi:uroporphyrinogen III methyltransferase/synthase